MHFRRLMLMRFWTEKCSHNFFTKPKWMQELFYRNRWLLSSIRRCCELAVCWRFLYRLHRRESYRIASLARLDNIKASLHLLALRTGRVVSVKRIEMNWRLNEMWSKRTKFDILFRWFMHWQPWPLVGCVVCVCVCIHLWPDHRNLHSKNISHFVLLMWHAHS